MCEIIVTGLPVWVYLLPVHVSLQICIALHRFIHHTNLWFSKSSKCFAKVISFTKCLLLLNASHLCLQFYSSIPLFVNGVFSALYAANYVRDTKCTHQMFVVNAWVPGNVMMCC